MTIAESMRLTGRVIARSGETYTVTSASTRGEVCVWDPRRRELLRFDSRETFENWAYGKPVPAAGIRTSEATGEEKS